MVSKMLDGKKYAFPTVFAWILLLQSSIGFNVYVKSPMPSHHLSAGPHWQGPVEAIKTNWCWDGCIMIFIDFLGRCLWSNRTWRCIRCKVSVELMNVITARNLGPYVPKSCRKCNQPEPTSSSVSTITNEHSSLECFEVHQSIFREDTNLWSWKMLSSCQAINTNKSLVSSR